MLSPPLSDRRRARNAEDEWNEGIKWEASSGIYHWRKSEMSLILTNIDHISYTADKKKEKKLYENIQFICRAPPLARPAIRRWTKIELVSNTYRIQALLRFDHNSLL